MSRKSDQKLYAYGSKQPLNVLGTFSALVRVEGKETVAEFVVINGEGAALLGRETAIQLGVLELGTQICTVHLVRRSCQITKRSLRVWGS